MEQGEGMEVIIVNSKITYDFVLLGLAQNGVGVLELTWTKQKHIRQQRQRELSEYQFP